MVAVRRIQEYDADIEGTSNLQRTDRKPQRTLPYITSYVLKTDGSVSMSVAKMSFDRRFTEEMPDLVDRSKDNTSVKQAGVHQDKMKRSQRMKSCLYHWRDDQKAYINVPFERLGHKGKDVCPLIQAKLKAHSDSHNIKVVI